MSLKLLSTAHRAVAVAFLLAASAIPAGVIAHAAPHPAAAPTVAAHPAAAATTPNWQFVWGDTFSGPLDLQKWGAAEGYYNPYIGTDQAFASFDAATSNNNLVITTEHRQFNTKAYTSGMVWSKGRYSFTYGKIEVVAKVPPMGTGIWPAMWLQGNNNAAWPGPGGNEIDFAELWNTPSVVHDNLHYADTANGTDLGQNQGCTYQSPVDLSAGYHTYALVWQPGPILTYYVDNVQTCQLTPGASYFNTPMYVVLDTAVGASWMGHPDSTVPFPQQFSIQSVAVYHDQNLP